MWCFAVYCLVIAHWIIGGRANPITIMPAATFDTITPSIPVNTTIEPSCPQGWRMFGTNCYVLIAKQNSRSVENYCQKMYGAHSASVHSAEEISFVVNMSTDYSDKWIGLFSTDNSVTWSYTDGTKFDFQPWSNGWPQIDTPPCATTFLTRGIYPVDCGSKLYGVCKKPANI